MAAQAGRRLVLIGALAFAAVVAHSSAAVAATPCATADDTCVVTPPTSNPQWITVPAWANGDPGYAFNYLRCPAGSVAAGIDWTAPPGAPQLNVDVALLKDGWPSPIAVFYASSALPTATATTYAPFLGCVKGEPAAAAAGLRPRPKYRLRTLRVRPGTRRVARSRCRKGERHLRGGAAVVFDSRPSRRELNDHDYRHRVGRRGVRVKLTAGRTVGDDERVTLQVLAVCL